MTPLQCAHDFCSMSGVDKTLFMLSDLFAAAKEVTVGTISHTLIFARFYIAIWVKHEARACLHRQDTGRAVQEV